MSIRTLAFLLALAMMLCACGDTSGNVAIETPTEASTTAPTEALTEAPTEAPSEDSNQYSLRQVILGKFEGGKYKNLYAGFDGLMGGLNGIGCEFDEAWTIYLAEDLQELSDTVEAILEGADWESAAGTTEQFWDMKAENASEMTSVNVLYTGLGFDYKLYQWMTEERIVNMMLEQESTLIATLESAGCTDVKLEKVSVNFLGQKHVAVKTYAKVLGVNYYTLQVVDYSAGPYGVTITTASYFEDKTQQILDMFYPINALSEVESWLEE